MGGKVKKDDIVSVGLAFDDVLLLPRYSDFVREDVNLSVRLTKKIRLSTPLVSSPMDRVTGSELAIALAQCGGIGILHRNLTITNQVKEVRKVKSANCLVGAAIGVGEGFKERIDALVAAGVDVICMDAAHGYTRLMIDAVGYIKKTYANLEVIAGNVATYDGARALAKAGADAVRVGMGPGAICTTRVISGMGVPQFTAIRETVRAAKEFDVPVIADGGIKHSGDMVKALAAGASTIMMGSFFASAVESPGKVVKLPAMQVPARFKDILRSKVDTYTFKEYRGMGSVGAMEEGARINAEDEFHGKSFSGKVLVAEGVESLVPVKGTVQELCNQAEGGIRSGFFYVGAKSISELQQFAEFLQITQASLTESHPHDVLITNAGENY
jgi:IMP dehydrogenase